MNERNNIKVIALSLLLNVLFLFPLSIQFIHVLEGHKHTVCAEHTTHFHKTKTACKICDFHFTPFVFETIFKVKETTEAISNTLYISAYNYSHSKKYYTSKKLRGPPTYS